VAVDLPWRAQAYGRRTGSARWARANPAAVRAGGERAGSGGRAGAGARAGVGAGAGAGAGASNGDGGGSL